MLILGIDTATPRLSLALCEGQTLLAERRLWPDKRQAEVILSELDVLLRAAGRKVSDLQGIAVGLGPGSFTGLRVGIATAQGLAQSLGVPVAGISSFMAMAAASGAGQALVIDDARQDMLYAAAYARRGESWERLLPEGLFSIPELVRQLPPGPMALTGPAAEVFYPRLRAAGAGEMPLIPAPNHLPDAAIISRFAAPLLAEGGQRPEELLPLYLRKTQAEEMRQKNECGNV